MFQKALIVAAAFLPCWKAAAQTGSQKAVISLNKEIQTIHSFGASDCWSTKFIGTWRDEHRKNQVADLLFSMDTLANGQPKGIGLSLWRMNIGAGSLEQGDSSLIGDEWRREESFQKPDGSYDWTRQPGSQWFLHAARKRGVPYTLGFSVSPPVHMTLNGKAFSHGGKSLNLKPERMADFAAFLTDVSQHFKFDYLSPLNEPQWDWKAGKNGHATQEGTPATNAEMLRLAGALSERMLKHKSETTTIIGEAGQLDYIYDKAETERGNQLGELFSSQQKSLKNLPGIAPILSYHSYFTTCNDSVLVTTRQKAAHAAKAAGVALWQSEFGILGDICGKYNGYPRNTGIDYGLYVAKVIHHDLAVANVTSWQWWLAVSPYNYSDALVYINDVDGHFKNHNNTREQGLVGDSKQLWAFGNYARFIRPGMKRVDVQLPGNPDLIAQAANVMLSAYKDVASKRLVIVAVNVTEKDVMLPLEGVAIPNNRFETYTTSEDKSLHKTITDARKLMLAPKSVTTFVGNYR